MTELTLKGAVEKALRKHIGTIKTVLDDTPNLTFLSITLLGFIIENNELFPKGLSDEDPENIVRAVTSLHEKADLSGKNSLKAVFESINNQISEISEETLDERNLEMLRRIESYVTVALSGLN